MISMVLAVFLAQLFSVLPQAQTVHPAMTAVTAAVQCPQAIEAYPPIFYTTLSSLFLAIYCCHSPMLPHLCITITNNLTITSII